MSLADLNGTADYNGRVRESPPRWCSADYGNPGSGNQWSCKETWLSTLSEQFTAILRQANYLEGEQMKLTS